MGKQDTRRIRPSFLVFLGVCCTWAGYHLSTYQNNKADHFFHQEDTLDINDMNFTGKPSLEELHTAVADNQNIDDQIATYFYRFIDTLYEVVPEKNWHLFKQNVEHLQVEFFDEEDVNNSSTIKKTTTAFFSSECDQPCLYFKKGLPLEKSAYHEFVHMLKSAQFSLPDGRIFLSQFASDGLGQGLEEEIVAAFTNKYLYNETSYKEENVYLLHIILKEEEVYKTFFEGNIYDIIDMLEKVNKDLNAKRFMKLLDYQNEFTFDDDLQQDHFFDEEIYQQYLSYFSTQENKQLFTDFEHYIATFITDSNRFQEQLQNLSLEGTTKLALLQQLTNCIDDLLEQGLTKHIEIAPTPDIEIISDVPQLAQYLGSKDVVLYQQGQYLGLVFDDAQDGIYDIFTGTMVYPDETSAQTIEEYRITAGEPAKIYVK